MLSLTFESLLVCCLSYAWNLPTGFPLPPVPADNPMTPAKVALGRHLFYDTRLSVNEKQACATCHRQALAFTDGRPFAVGTTGLAHPRGAMSLVNVAYASVLTWNNPRPQTLEEQMLVPLFGEHPLELGLPSNGSFVSKLEADPKYRELFSQAFPQNSNPFTVSHIAQALACFERTIISARSPWDRYHYARDDSAVSESAKRGEILFFSQPLSCFRCHGGFNFGGRGSELHNTGLYNPYPAANPGASEVTHNPSDTGKFKAPTLRNIALTAPYMHDGSIPTLEAALDHYAAGGRAHDNPLKDPLIAGFPLSLQDKLDLIEFLKALTDESLLHDPRFANPWRP